MRNIFIVIALMLIAIELGNITTTLDKIAANTAVVQKSTTNK